LFIDGSPQVLVIGEASSALSRSNSLWNRSGKAKVDESADVLDNRIWKELNKLIRRE